MPITLGATYQNKTVHEEWRSVYRRDPKVALMDDAIMGCILRIADLPREARVLDAGCGTGEHTNRFAAANFCTVGVDISETALAEARATCSSRAAFFCMPLEGIRYSDDSFDLVHCRGVLMHIPDWKSALKELCRVLKPNGKLVLMESNSNSVETMTVRLVRRIQKRESRMVETEGGLEFWSEHDGQPFLVRIAHVAALIDELKRNGLRLTHRLASQFWDINRFPLGSFRSAAICFNRIYFALRLPAGPAMGNLLIAQKVS